MRRQFFEELERLQVNVREKEDIIHQLNQEKPDIELLKTSFRCFRCLGLGAPLELEFATHPLSDVGPVFVWGDDEVEGGETRLTTVFTLDELGVGTSFFAGVI